jgi:uncharacterized protein (DUF983 family)
LKVIPEEPGLRLLTSAGPRLVCPHGKSGGTARASRFLTCRDTCLACTAGLLLRRAVAADVAALLNGTACA